MSGDSILGNGTWTFTHTSRGCENEIFPDLTKHYDPLGCRLEISPPNKRQLCLCDTDFCNAGAPNEDEPFSCYAGDLDLASLDQAYNTNHGDLMSLLSFQVVSCYSNRDQCFQMKYKGMTAVPIQINLKSKVGKFRTSWGQN